MSGYHLIKENEKDIYYSGSSQGGFGHISLYINPPIPTYILSISEKFNKNVHGFKNQGNYVEASIRFEEDELIERILEMVPFWKIRAFEENRKRKFLSNHAEELKSLGVDDNSVNQIKNTILNCGIK